MATVETASEEIKKDEKDPKLSIQTEEEEEKKLDTNEIKQNTTLSSQSSEESMRDIPSSLHAQPTPSSQSNKLSISNQSNDSEAKPKQSKVHC